MFATQSQVTAFALASFLFGPGLQEAVPSDVDGAQPQNEVAKAKRPAPSLTLEQRIEQSGATWHPIGPLDAQITLIHFRNFHLTGAQSPLGPSAERYWAVQRDIFELISRCAEKYQFAGAYADGITDRGFDINLERLADVKKGLGDNREKPLKQMLAEAGGNLQASGALVGAVIRWNIPLKCAESFELHRQAAEAQRIGAAHADDIVLTARENELLRRIAVDFPSGSVTVFSDFGADHRFEDNITVWNAAHPERKFRAIEITPKTVLEIRGESQR